MCVCACEWYGGVVCCNMVRYGVVWYGGMVVWWYGGAVGSEGKREMVSSVCL